MGLQDRTVASPKERTTSPLRESNATPPRDRTTTPPALPRTPTPSPPPKVKVSLKDFAMRKKTQREEEEKEIKERGPVTLVFELSPVVEDNNVCYNNLAPSHSRTRMLRPRQVR